MDELTRFNVISSRIRLARNIEGVKASYVGMLNVYDVLNHDKFIVAKDAIAKLEEVYA